MLICSDGHASAENAIRFMAKTAAVCSAEVTLLGVVEHPDDQSKLGEALRRGAQLLLDKGVHAETVTGKGRPIEQIKQRTHEQNYDLVVVGAERKRSSPFALSTKAYYIIKGIDPPVLVMIGSHAELRRILVCSRGEPPLPRPIALTAEIARGSRAAVTLLHVLAAPPLLYSDLLERQISGVDKLLASDYALARNLRREKDAFEKLGVPVDVKLRSGEVGNELLREARAGDYDLIVTGSTRSGGLIGAYVMGDVTAAVVDGADCAVLVVRDAAPQAGQGPFFTALRRLFEGLKSKLKDS
jgi:nucleotide-binding universal stress UspA family protein